jgi:hypothetical protein
MDSKEGVVGVMLSAGGNSHAPDGNCSGYLLAKVESSSDFLSLQMLT